ncbi:MAG: hypothetical protein OIF47_13830 [Marinibacterium sp.]|nr:hypothetical protein [Marinibacterium sp.]
MQSPLSNNTAFLMAMGEGSTIQIHGANYKTGTTEQKQSWAQLSQNAMAGSDRIVLGADTRWEAGDKIAIAASGFSTHGAETRVITDVAVEGGQLVITLDQPLLNDHLSLHETYGPDGKPVDMRAEVALLSRNVTIQGDDDGDGLGGHTMVMMGAEQYIEGVEYYRMGQEGVLGRYPVHWHKLQTDGAGQYASGISVHGSYNKGITIHDTNETWVEDTVIFDTLGHGVYFEDATETGNVLKDNLVFGQKTTDNPHSPSEWTFASGFWVTNPNNHLIGNHAAGSEGTGIWVTSEAAPLNGNPSTIVPQEQPLGIISGNTVHSTTSDAVFIGWTVGDDGETDPSTQFVRTDELGRMVNWGLEDLTVYSLTNAAPLRVYARGGQLSDIKVVDVQKGMILFGDQQLSDSLFVARSRHTLEQGADMARPYTGIALYDFMIEMKDLYVEGYNGAHDYFFFQRGGALPSSQFTVEGINFVDTPFDHRFTNEMFAGLVQLYRNANGDDWVNEAGMNTDSGTAVAILDVDGSLLAQNGQDLQPGRVLTPFIPTHYTDTDLNDVQVVEAGFNAAPGAVAYQLDDQGTAAPDDDRQLGWINPAGTQFGILRVATDDPASAGDRMFTLTKTHDTGNGPEDRGSLQFTQDSYFLALAHDGSQDASVSEIEYHLSVAMIDSNRTALDQPPTGRIFLEISEFAQNDAVMLTVDTGGTTPRISNARAMTSLALVEDASRTAYFHDVANDLIYLKIVATEPQHKSNSSDQQMLEQSYGSRTFGASGNDQVVIDFDNGFPVFDFSLSMIDRSFVDREVIADPLRIEAAEPDALDASDLDTDYWSKPGIWDGGITDDTILVIDGGRKVILDASGEIRVKGIVISGEGSALGIKNDSGLDMTLIADWILVRDKGLFQAGTTSNPLETHFTLELTGDDPDFDLDVDAVLNGGHPDVVRAIVNPEGVTPPPEFEGDDSLMAGPGNDTLKGHSGHDTLKGNDGDDHLDGGSGDDRILGFAGNDSLLGGSGADELHGNGGNDTLLGGMGADTLWGGGHDDWVEGGDGDDVFDELSGANTLIGGTGNDTFRGGSGADDIQGGMGFDVVSYDGQGAYTTGGAATVDLSDSANNAGAAAGDSLDGFEGVIGSSLADSLTGNDAGNLLDGGAGDDTLTGGVGDDTLVGGAGADHLDGAGDFDIASYAGADSVGVNLQTLVLTGAAAGDTLIGIEGVIGSSLADSLTGDDAGNLLDGGAGDDTLTGGAGDDTLIGGAGADHLAGGPGFDLASYAGADSVTVDLSASTNNTGIAAGDTLIGVEGLSGSDNDDCLTGDDADNRLIGGAGNDTLTGGAGDDTLIGGAGRDEVSYAGACAVTVNLSDNTRNAGAAAGDTLTGIENVIGSELGDILKGDHHANELHGGLGNDLLLGSSGADTLNGGEGIDTLSYSDALSGVVVDLSPPENAAGGNKGDAEGDVLDGIEILKGSNFADYIVTGYGSGVVKFLGGSGNDTIVGGSDADVLVGNGDDDLVKGQGGDDKLYGSQGDDTLHGGAGADTLDGGAGLDIASYDGADSVEVDLQTAVLAGAAAGDTLTGIEGVIGSTAGDLLRGSGDANVLDGSDGDDWIVGRAGDDTLLGGAGQDSLYGNADSDVLIGGDSADTLDGGVGDDTLTGGTGADHFVFSDGGGHDVITDFGAGGADDIIDLRGLETVSDYDDLTGNHLVMSDGSVVIDSGSGHTLTLLGVDLQTLTVDHFLF